MEFLKTTNKKQEKNEGEELKKAKELLLRTSGVFHNQDTYRSLTFTEDKLWEEITMFLEKSKKT